MLLHTKLHAVYTDGLGMRLVAYQGRWLVELLDNPSDSHRSL